MLAQQAVATSRLPSAHGSPVDQGWEAAAPAESSQRPSLTVLENESTAAEARRSLPLEAEPSLDDGWSLGDEPARAGGPRLEVVGRSSQAVPVPIHDDGWAVGTEPDVSGVIEQPASKPKRSGAIKRRIRLSSNAEEEAFFEAGDSLMERREPVDSFDDLDEERGSLWDRFRAWLRR